MELLPAGQQNTAEVLWEDQQKINRFSSVINKKDQLVAQLEKYKTEKEYVDDLALEIELLDDDEKVQYKVGDSFVFVGVTRAVEMIEKENEVLDKQIDSTADEISELDLELATLKAHLYGKFGNNINLER